MLYKDPFTTEQFDADSVVEQLISGLQQAAHEITPGFIHNMPRAYFDDTTQEMRLAHIKAILAAEASGMSQTLTLRDADDRHFTFISNRSYPGQLSEFVRRLPRDLPLTSAQVYTSEQGDRVLDIFHFGEHKAYDASDQRQRAKAGDMQEYVKIQHEKLSSGTVQQHLTSCDVTYLVNTPPEQIYRHLLMAEQIRKYNNVVIQLERYHDHDLNRLTIGFWDYNPRLIFERVSHYLGREAIDIRRAYLDSFKDQDEDITLLTFIVKLNDQVINSASDKWQHIEFNLRRLPHLDVTVFELSEDVTGGDLQHAELLVALSRLAHIKS